MLNTVTESESPLEDDESPVESASMVSRKSRRSRRSLRCLLPLLKIPFESVGVICLPKGGPGAVFGGTLCAQAATIFCRSCAAAKWSQCLASDQEAAATPPRQPCKRDGRSAGKIQQGDAVHHKNDENLRPRGGVSLARSRFSTASAARSATDRRAVRRRARRASKCQQGAIASLIACDGRAHLGCATPVSRPSRLSTAVPFRTFHGLRPERHCRDAHAML